MLANKTITATGAAGIVVAASHVTVDLNGFTLAHLTGSGGNGITIQGSNVTIMNGIIRGGTTVVGSTFTPNGWLNGVEANPLTLQNIVVKSVSVSGTRGDGLHLGYGGSRAESCSVNVAADIGIYASNVAMCTARNCNTYGISSSSYPDGGSISDCFGESVGSGTSVGIWATDSPVSNSTGIAVSGSGITAETVTNCHAKSQTSAGISAQTVTNSVGRSTSGDGISATTVTDSLGTSVSAIGIIGEVVTNSRATSSSGSTALAATVATNCVASRSGGVAISASTANGCVALSGTVTATNKYNMP